MSQTNTNIGGGNTNRNQNAARDGHGGVGSGGRGCTSCTSSRGNSSIAKFSFEGKIKMVVFPSSQSLGVLVELLNARKLLILCQSIVQTKDTGMPSILFVKILNY